MKKALYGILALTMAASLAGCSSKTDNGGNDGGKENTPAAAGPDTEKGEGVMTYAEYADANVDDKVTIEAYVQAKQSWWDNKGTFFAQDADGGYFIYEMQISEDDYKKLVEGQKVKISGYKAEWSGEVEIIEAEYEILDGNWIAPAKDVTADLNTDKLIDSINQKVVFKGLKIEPAEFTEGGGVYEVYKNEAGEDQGYMYKYNGTGAQGDDVYFTVSKDGVNFTFLVRSYLTDSSTDVYKAAEAFEIGKTYDLEGFLYWYNGANPYITNIKAN
ncbi:MAG: hypothetical protein Q4D59_05025 [Erysipelotrichaceae bacterium]|jgi:hypothetical protein|nr:hypothetical protein [Erysipelotrichaceae bacterium]